jgi:hypothetical protein
MGLLYKEMNAQTDKLAQIIFERHFEADPKLKTEYDSRRKALMYEDILYNLQYLDTAIKLNDGAVFSNYAVWLYSLLCNLMKDISRDRIKDQMVDHYKILMEVLSENMTDEMFLIAGQYLRNAIKMTEQGSIAT